MIINAFPAGYGAPATSSGGEEGGGEVYTDIFRYTGEYQKIDDGDGNWRLKLLTSGTLSFIDDMSVDLFAVGGGGGGRPGLYRDSDVTYLGNVVGRTYEHMGGGGGAGGYTATIRGARLEGGVEYQVNIGAGGPTGGEGGTTSLGDLISAQGGKLPSHNWYDGDHGGSGGGGGSYKETGYYQNEFSAGEGGSDGGDGAGQARGTGQGATTREFGEETGDLYAGGGGGGNHLTGEQMKGGAGGGGDGASIGTVYALYATAGGQNTGGGGGGGTENLSAGPGGSGILIIRNARAWEDIGE